MSVQVPVLLPLLHVQVPADHAELACDRLWTMGVLGIEERGVADGVVELIAGCATPEAARALLGAWRRRWPAWVEDAPDAAVLDTWRTSWSGTTIDDRVVVVPVDAGVAPDSVDPRAGRDLDGRIRVVLDPGRAFGAGTHPTTRLAVAAAAELGSSASVLLDAGCGTGVVAVCGLLAGAASAVAVDVDADAVRLAEANARRNGVADRLRGAVADLSDPAAVGAVIPGSFDVAIVNLTLDGQRTVIPAISGAFASGAVVVATGLLASQIDEFLILAPAADVMNVQVSEAEDGAWAACWLNWRSRAF